MSFLKSVLFGHEGSYNILGIPVTFTNQDHPPFNSNQGETFTQFAKNYLSNNAFRWIAQTYTHTFVHEMGHALASQLFPRPNLFCRTPQAQVVPKVKIFIKSAEGVTKNATLGLLGWKRTFVCAAGPMMNIAFSSCKLIAAQALKSNYLTLPIAFILEGGAYSEMATELYYAYDSISKENDGDFGMIAHEGSLPLSLASVALVTECALGVLISSLIV